jgi:peptide/nickel transport system permease protein
MEASLSSAIASPETKARSPLQVESYWDLVLRQFRRNRMAVASLIFVVLLSFVAVIAPFLASNVPIVLIGAYRGAYQDRFEEWRLGGHRELVNLMASWQSNHSPEAAVQLRARLGTVERQLGFLGTQLPSGQARRLGGFAQDYRKAVEIALAGNGTAVSDELRKLESDFQAISQNFDPGKVQLARKLYWPIFRVLGAMNIFFLALTAMLLLLPVLLPLLRRGLRPEWRAGSAIPFLLVCLPPLLIYFYWSGRPAAFDTMDYKQDLFNGRIESSLALFPPVPYGINEGHLGDKYLPPGSRYWTGTDGNGRDLLTRMIWGSQISLSVGFVAVAIYVLIGIIVGTIGGYFLGWVDMLLSRMTEIVICFPAFFLILAVLAFLQPSILNIMIVIGITGWTTEARLVRGEFLRLNDQEFVLAAKALGVSDFRIIFRHILPNGLAPLLVSASFGIASAILIESSLSFLGFGISIPVPSWGGILNEARESFRYWWITIFPGLAIFSTVTAYNLLGEGVRDAIDPRLKL